MLDFAQRYNCERATIRIPQLIAVLPEPRSPHLDHLSTLFG